MLDAAAALPPRCRASAARRAYALPAAARTALRRAVLRAPRTMGYRRHLVNNMYKRTMSVARNGGASVA